jgi:predicted metal-dependent phosphoesterase TrpH
MEKKPAERNKQQLGNLLARYKERFKPPQASVVKECIEVIESVTGIILEQKHLTYTVSSRTVVVQTSSLIRSELKTHHSAITTELQKRLGAHNAPTVII